VRRQEFLCFLTLRYAPLDHFLEKLLLVELPLQVAGFTLGRPFATDALTSPRGRRHAT
jgi:hypothetical protein